MDANAALARATQALREIEEPGEPLTLSAPDTPGEYEWCWVYPFNTVRGMQTGRFADSVTSGPLVVPKNGAQVWVAPSGPPIERWLNKYAELRGLSLVPVPEPSANPFG